MALIRYISASQFGARRLVAGNRLAQGLLDRAVAAGVSASQVPAVIPITDEFGDRTFVYVVPVTRNARDVFIATAAIVVVKPDRAKPGPAANLIRAALDLTEHEAQIAALLAEGLNLVATAERLHLGVGTTRNHMKSIFRKTGTRRQGELVALLCAFRL